MDKTLKKNIYERKGPFRPVQLSKQQEMAGALPAAPPGPGARVNSGTPGGCGEPGAFSPPAPGRREPARLEGKSREADAGMRPPSCLPAFPPRWAGGQSRHPPGRAGAARWNAAGAAGPGPGGGGVHLKGAAEPMRRKGPSMWGGCLHQPGPGSFNPAGGEARRGAGLPGRCE